MKKSFVIISIAIALASSIASASNETATQNSGQYATNQVNSAGASWGYAGNFQGATTWQNPTQNGGTFTSTGSAGAYQDQHNQGGSMANMSAGAAFYGQGVTSTGSSNYGTQSQGASIFTVSPGSWHLGSVTVNQTVNQTQNQAGQVGAYGNAQANVDGSQGQGFSSSSNSGVFSGTYGYVDQGQSSGQGQGMNVSASSNNNGSAGASGNQQQNSTTTQTSHVVVIH